MKGLFLICLTALLIAGSRMVTEITVAQTKAQAQIYTATLSHPLQLKLRDPDENEPKVIVPTTKEKGDL